MQKCCFYFCQVQKWGLLHSFAFNINQCLFLLFLLLSVNFSTCVAQVKRCAKKNPIVGEEVHAQTRHWWISLKLTCQSEPQAKDKSHTLSENTDLLLRISLLPRSDAELCTDRSGFSSKDKALGGTREREAPGWRRPGRRKLPRAVNNDCCKRDLGGGGDRWHWHGEELSQGQRSSWQTHLTLSMQSFREGRVRQTPQIISSLGCWLFKPCLHPDDFLFFDQWWTLSVSFTAASFNDTCCMWDASTPLFHCTLFLWCEQVVLTTVANQIAPTGTIKTNLS